MLRPSLLVAVAAIALASACRRAPTRAQIQRGAILRAALDVPVASAPAPQTRPSAWTWSDPSPLGIPAPTSAPLQLFAECSSDTLAVVARSGTTAWAARRRLRADAPWSDPLLLGNDVASVGRLLVDAGAAWVPWLTPLGTLRVARAGDALERFEDTAPGRNAMFRDAHVIYARDGKALVASTYRGVLASRVLLHRVERGQQTPASALLGDGALAVSATGERAELFTTVRLPDAAGGPWVLRGWRISSRAALAIPLSPTPGVFGAVPAGSSERSYELALGSGHFEFAPHLASRSRALLFETVIGAERGALRVAWFPANGLATTTSLPTAATSLGATLDLDERPDAAAITYWDDRRALVQTKVTRGGMSEPQELEREIATEHEVYATARRTRWLHCGGSVWRVEAVGAANQWQVNVRRSDGHQALSR